MTEHFNTQQFDEVYGYIAEHGRPVGDAFAFDGLRVFPGMETDIAEGGHVLCIGPMDANPRTQTAASNRTRQKAASCPLPTWPACLTSTRCSSAPGTRSGAGGHIPDLPGELLARFDFLDLNGKDIAEDRARTERLTYGFGHQLQKPVVAGSDTHQAVQYGCIRTHFDRDVSTFRELYAEMQAGAVQHRRPPGRRRQGAHGRAAQARPQGDPRPGRAIMSRCCCRESGESPAVLAAKHRLAG